MERCCSDLRRQSLAKKEKNGKGGAWRGNGIA
nr:MAG TPA: hypothetical protein [Bacteriophage sp.]